MRWSYAGFLLRKGQRYVVVCLWYMGGIGWMWGISSSKCSVGMCGMSDATGFQLPSMANGSLSQTSCLRIAGSIEEH